MAEVYLRPLSLDDTENIVRWRNAPSVRKNLFSQSVLTEEQHEAYYKEYILSEKCKQFIIVVCDENGEEDIGTIFIKNIDYQNKKGELGIFIGEDGFRGKGFSKSAIGLLLQFAFESLFLNKVYLSVLVENTNAIKAYKNQGFRIDGQLRADYCREEQFYDVLIMSVLRGEWKMSYNRNSGGGYSADITKPHILHVYASSVENDRGMAA